MFSRFSHIIYRLLGLYLRNNNTIHFIKQVCFFTCLFFASMTSRPFCFTNNLPSCEICLYLHWCYVLGDYILLEAIALFLIFWNINITIIFKGIDAVDFFHQIIITACDYFVLSIAVTSAHSFSCKIYGVVQNVIIPIRKLRALKRQTP